MMQEKLNLVGSKKSYVNENGEYGNIDRGETRHQKTIFSINFVLAD